MSNAFWEFSLATYQADGVAEAALAVQDQLGLDINLILYASWLASLGLNLSDSHLVELKSLTERWQWQVVIPLRGVRIELKGNSSVAALRDRVKALELSCEKHQQQMMWEYFTAADPLEQSDKALHENLSRLVTPEMSRQPSWGLLEDKLFRLSCG